MASERGALPQLPGATGTSPVEPVQAPVAGLRRPVWPDGRGGRRPSGQDRVSHPAVPRGVWVCTLVLVLAVGLLILWSGRPGGFPTVDRAVRELLPPPGSRPGVATGLVRLGSGLGYRALWVPTVLVLVWTMRWRHLLVYVASISVMAAVAQLAAGQGELVRVVREGVTGTPEVLSIPAWPVVVLSTVAVGSLYALTPSGRPRRWGWAGVLVLVAAQALSRIALDLDLASAALASSALGCSAAALAFQLFAPEHEFPVTYHRQVKAHLRLDGPRAERVLTAVRDQLGIELAAIEPYRLAGSAGSTPCRLRLAQGPPGHLFGKLYATSHLRSDRWYKLVRVLRYGRLEDEAPFSSVRRLVEHEDYMLRLLRDGGVRVPDPVGVVEVVPGREYLLITELVPDAVEILESDVDDAVIDSALVQVRQLWAAGAAHRDVKPSNVLVQGRRVVLIDVSFGELRPSRWRQAVDLANMMLTLALGAGPERVLGRALRFFDREELAEAFAATSSLTLPTQLRRRLEEGGRDLVAEFRALLPSHPRIRVQRWSVRRGLLAVGAVGGVVLGAVLLALNLRAGGLL